MAFFTLVTTGSTNWGTLFTDVLYIVCMVALFFHFERKASAAVNFVVQVMVFFLLECMLDVILDLFGLSSYQAPTFVSLFVVLILCASMQRRLKASDRIVRASTYASLFAVNVGITRVMAPAFPILDSLWFGSYVASAFSYICLVASTLFVRHFSIEGFDYVSKGSLILVVCVDALGIAAVQIFISLVKNYNDYFVGIDSAEVLDAGMWDFIVAISRVNLSIDFIFLALMFIACYLFYALTKEHDERAEMLVTKRSEADNESVVAVTKTMYEQLREVRHEIRNHDAYLVALLDEGDYDKLREVLMSQVGERAEVIRRVSTGNLTVDAVVNAKIALAQADGIHVETMLAAPEKLPFDDDDVFRLIANLMDNAIEGVKTAGVEGATITLQLQPKGGYWFITVRNPCDPAKVNRGSDGRLKTSKPDGDVHGYGTRVISRIAEKYQGTAHFSVEGGTFVASVMLVGEEVGAADLKKAA